HTESLDEGLINAELDRSRALAGPALLGTGAVEAGTWSVWLSDVEDEEKLTRINQTLPSLAYHNSIELPMADGDTLVAAFEEKSTRSLTAELIRDHRLVGISTSNRATWDVITNLKDNAAVMPPSMLAEDGKPLLLYVGSFEPSIEAMPL